ncbi:hypothetical protein [Phaeobacter sp.]|uniref:hypothetical protein n=1 Tax=Phaeobacter sp. TaxID=1902409 RepID=UPI0025FBBB14|nr:hypothetical protein [Phaeobacter sp.]
MKKLLPSLSAIMLLASQAPAFAEDLDFLLINESSADLVEFNVSPASSETWEDNLLAGGYLAPDYEIEVLIADGATTCIYDIRGAFSDGSEAEDYGLDLCDLGEYTFTD